MKNEEQNLKINIMKPARILAWLDLLNSGKANDKKKQVLQAIQSLGRATIDDIVSLTKMPMRTVSGRLSELTDMGLIRVVHKVKRGERILSVYEYVHDKMEQERLREEILIKKWKQAKKRYEELDHFVKEINRK
jgi:DNA-binding transcriptional ArsR family regulator